MPSVTSPLVPPPAKPAPAMTPDLLRLRNRWAPEVTDYVHHQINRGRTLRGEAIQVGRVDRNNRPGCDRRDSDLVVDCRYCRFVAVSRPHLDEAQGRRIDRIDIHCDRRYAARHGAIGRGSAWAEKSAEYLPSIVRGTFAERAPPATRVSTMRQGLRGVYTKSTFASPSAFVCIEGAVLDRSGVRRTPSNPSRPGVRLIASNWSDRSVQSVARIDSVCSLESFSDHAAIVRSMIDCLC